MIGISKIANTHSASQVTSGLILGGIGTVFLLRNLGYIYGNIWQYLWPGILIAVGLSILVKHLEGRGQRSGTSGISSAGIFSVWDPFARDSSVWRFLRTSSPGTSNSFAPGSGYTASTSGANYLHVECVFSGTRQRFETQDFLGGKVTTVFGGAEIDLRSVGPIGKRSRLRPKPCLAESRSGFPLTGRPLCEARPCLADSRTKRSRRLRARPAKRLVWWLRALRFLAAWSLKTDASHLPEHHQFGRLHGTVDASCCRDGSIDPRSTSLSWSQALSVAVPLCCSTLLFA